jgi:hypothetical protein
MNLNPFPPRIIRSFLVLTLVLLIGAPSLAQSLPATVTPSDPNQARPKRPKLSVLRGDDPEPSKDESLKPAPKGEPKKDEAESNSVGFFGDTKKFTRFGGWGSFGNAMGQFGFARATLIAMPPVQEELKLTPEQKKKIKEWQEEMRKKGEAMGKLMREKNGDDPLRAGDNQAIATRIFQFTSLMEQVSTFVKENENGLAKILKAPQRKRLNQISLQMEGISALTRPEIAEALGLLEEEQEQIRQILNGSRAQQMGTWIGSMMTMRPRKPGDDPKAGPSTKKPEEKAVANDDPQAEAKAKVAREKAMKQGFETMRDRTDQIHAATVKQIVNLLSRAQRARFEIMLGPPFDPRKINDLGQPPRRVGAAPSNEPKPTEDPKSSVKKSTDDR